MTTGRINQVAPSPRGIGKGIGIANVSPEGNTITNDTPYAKPLGRDQKENRTR